MKKQILYPKMIKRLFSTMTDLAIISIFLTPITNVINRWIFIGKFGKALEAQNIDIDNHHAVMTALQSKEFASQVTFVDMLEIGIPVLFIQSLFLMLYFVVSWYKLGCTPVKYMMHMRIVDKDTLKRPSIPQLMKRFLGYSLFFIGIWWILFTKQNQALHDKIANTIVIKV